MAKSSLGMEENVAGLLCYLFGWLSGLIFFILEKESMKVKFHALQSLIVFGALNILQIIISFIGSFISIFNILNIVVGILMLVIWIMGMIKAFKGEEFKLPVAGDIAESKING